MPQKVQIDIESENSEFERPRDPRSKEDRKEEEEAGVPSSEKAELMTKESEEERIEKVDPKSKVVEPEGEAVVMIGSKDLLS